MLARFFLETWSPAYAKKSFTKMPLKNARLAYAKRTIVKIGSESLPGGAQLKFEAGRSFFGARKFLLISSQRCASFFPARPPGPAGRSRLANHAEREFFEKSLLVYAKRTFLYVAKIRASLKRPNIAIALVKYATF